MSTTELVKLSAAEMAAKIKAKEVSSRELVEAHLAVIESAEPSVKAFLKVSADQATERPSNGWRPVVAGLRTGHEIGHTLVTQTRYC